MLCIYIETFNEHDYTSWGTDSSICHRPLHLVPSKGQGNPLRFLMPQSPLVVVGFLMPQSPLVVVGFLMPHIPHGSPLLEALD